MGMGMGVGMGIGQLARGRMATIVAVAAAAFTWAGPAAALQITNADATEQVVEVYEGDDGARVSQVTIAAGETKGDLCPSGCALLTDTSALGWLQDDEKVTIRDGHLERQR